MLRSRSKVGTFRTTENTIAKDRKIRVQRIVPNERVVAAVDKLKARQTITQHKSQLSKYPSMRSSLNSSFDCEVAEGGET